MAKIAIIDDAVIDSCLEHPVDRRYRLQHGIFREADGSSQATITHGTLVAKVLEQYATDYELISIQLLDNWFQEKRCPIEYLRQALEFCAASRCDMINLSLGTKRLSDYAVLADPLERLREMDIPVVAACSNSFHRTLPAAMRGVIGVACDRTAQVQSGTYMSVSDPYGGIDYIANYDLALPGIVDTQKSNSLVAVVVTARINDLLNRGLCGYDMRLELQKGAEQQDVARFGQCLLPEGGEEMPVVYLADVLTESADQAALLDMFAEDGYEVLGVSDDLMLWDARFLTLSSLPAQEIKSLQRALCACAKVDLVLVFTCAKWLPQQEWNGFDEESAAILCRNTLSDIPIQEQCTVKESTVQAIYGRLREVL